MAVPSPSLLPNHLSGDWIMFRFIMTRAIGTIAMLVAPAMCALAQSSGRIVGRVTDTQGAGVAGVQLITSPSGVSTISTEDGRYVLRSVPSGTASLRAYRFGFKPKNVEGIEVSAGKDVTSNVQLEAATVQLGGVVTSASRRVEKITDAPATITRLDEAQIANTIGNSFAGALKEVKGLEFIQTGILSSAVNARGFNSSFNNRILQVEDGRIGVLAESGLPVGSLTTLSKVDLAGVEVLVGPGSALYGPDASNGVVTLQTKDPRQYPGWTAEIDGGSRSFYDAQARYAGNNGHFGYKVAGEYVAVNEFANAVFYPAVATGGAPIPEKDANWRNDIIRGSGMLAYYTDNGSRLMATVGASKLNGIGPTNVGRNQLQNYGYRDYQLQYTGSRLFAQAYMSNSVAGTTFQLNGLAQNSVRFPSISYDSVKSLSAFPGDGRLQAAEVQNNFSVGMLTTTGISAIDNTHFTYGGQLRRDRVSSYGHWLSDRATGTPILINQKGVYGQSETPLSEMFRLVLAGRYDKHDKYDAQFSPKAALMFTPIQDQTFRVTYNKAFKSPSVLQTDFYFPNFQPFIGVFGNLDGFDIKNAAGTIINTIDPIRPEVNTTYEVGYKGVAGQRLFIDVAGYRTKFDGFLSPLVVIANPLAGAAATTAYDHKTGAKITDQAGGPQVALTYFNAAQATISGIDAGLRFYFTDKIAASGNVSVIRVDTIIRKVTDPPEATAFNSPSVRLTGGMDFTNVVEHLVAGFTMRYVGKYDFRSGVNYGLLPAFGTLDLSANYAVPGSGAKIVFQAQNIFSCVGGTTTPPALGIGSANQAVYTAGRSCKFGQEHQEMINAPKLGPIVLMGIRWDGR
jgi:outer membrane receptor for ferrienterochelin and colicins